MYSIFNNINNDKSVFQLDNQGKQLELNKKKHFQNINISKILETCDKEVCSVREAMDSNNSHTINVNFHEVVDDLKVKENKFNQKLKEYTDLQKSINEQQVRKNNFYNSNSAFLGKTVENHNTKFFINNFGYTHVYSNEAWDNDNKNCPKKAVSIKSGELNKFIKSVDMNVGQPCFVAGRIVKNVDNEEYAWVDLKGVKHVYANDDWVRKHSSCKGHHVLLLSNSNFNKIPSGSNMNTYDPCLKTDINPRDYLKLKKINNELISLAKEISKSTNQVLSKDEKINNTLNLKKHKLEKYLKDLDNNRQMIDNYEKTISTIVAQEEDTEKQYKAEYYMYLTWTLVALLLGGLTIKSLSK